MIKHIIALYTVVACCITAVYGQYRVEGRVQSPAGEGLAGASVSTRDRTIVAYTDSLGYFSATASSSKLSLLISLLGYEKKEVFVGLPLKNPAVVILQPSNKMLEEIEVSSGYQVLPKERATGAFSTVNKATFNEQVTPDILSRLEAVGNSIRVDRTTVGSDNNISIRGLSSIRGPKDILVVVDNFPFEGDLSSLNPNNVENITILKDAAAASIWGTRAGNGVIVINTKRGKKEQPIQINMDINYSIDPEPDIFYRPKMNSAEYIEFEKYKFSQSYRLADTSNKNHPSFSPVYELMLSHKKGELSSSQLESMLSDLAQYDVRRDYQDYVYRTGHRQQYALNIVGGGEKASFYFFTGYDKAVSSLGADYDRINFNFKNTYTPIKAINVSTSLLYGNSRSMSGRMAYDATIEPYVALMGDDNNALAVTRTYRQSYLDTLGGGRLLDWGYYPLLEGEYINGTVRTSNLLFNASVDYTAFNWATLAVKYQYERQIQNDNTLYKEESYYARDLINRYSQFEPTSGNVKYVVPRGGIIDLDNNDVHVHNFRAQLTIDKVYGSHRLNGIIGGEFRKRQSAGHSLRRYGYDPALNTYLMYDPLSRYPDIISGTTAQIPSREGFTDADNRYISGFANLSYSLRSKYILSGSLRRDASNLFGLKTNEKWNLLGSVGVAWLISDEAFFNLRSIPYLKLRATYGYSGNVDPGRSALTTIIHAGQTVYTGQPYAAIAQYSNPELRWEKIGMANLALDFGLFNRRVNGSIDFFFKNATDLFGPSEVDYTTGLSGTMLKNVAGLRGSGVDIELSSKNISTDRFSWSSILNVSTYKDKIYKYYEDPSYRNSTVIAYSSPSPTYLKDYPLYSMFSFRWAGLDPQNGDPIGYYNGVPSKDWDGILSSTHRDDLVFQGATIPTIFGSLGNTLSYKNISLTTRLRYSFGYYFRRPSIDYVNMIRRPNAAHPDYLDRWQTSGDELRTDIPSFVYPIPTNRDGIYANSEKTVERGDHIRLQYVRVSYYLSNEQVRSLPVHTVNFYMNVNNIGVIWKSNNVGIDPEYVGGMGMPNRASYSIGLKITL